MSNPNFWDNKQNSENLVNELSNLKNITKGTLDLKNKVETNLELIPLLEQDLETKEVIEEELTELKKELETLELELLLSGKYDSNNALVEIHSGAGGTEACDWANMLFRMYMRYSEKKGYKTEIIDEVPGEETGYNSVAFIARGLNAYGYLKGETGIHRLVRLSPFDSNNRRHTSFASITVTPIIDNNTEFVIDESEIRVDVYRSSGSGGQGVNTTDSAVRITHIPTNIVVTCQNERSQIQNKEQALNILKSKLLKLELERQEQELNNIKGEIKDINFGSQIRSYVMHPYSMVKDHRYNTETSNVDKVMDGDIDIFIQSYLKNNIKVKKN